MQVCEIKSHLQHQNNPFWKQNNSNITLFFTDTLQAKNVSCDITELIIMALTITSVIS